MHAVNVAQAILKAPSRRHLLLAAACITAPEILTACSSSDSGQSAARALRTPGAHPAGTAPPQCMTWCVRPPWPTRATTRNAGASRSPRSRSRSRPTSRAAAQLWVLRTIISLCRWVAQRRTWCIPHWPLDFMPIRPCILPGTVAFTWKSSPRRGGSRPVSGDCRASMYSRRL